MRASTRVVFHLPSENEFSTLLGEFPLLSGSGLGDINRVKFAPPTRLHQRGGGFFSSLANLAKSAVPFLMRTIAPNAMKFTQDVISDVSSGQRNVRGALKKRGIEALKGVGSQLLAGGKRKRKKSTTTSKNKNKRSHHNNTRKKKKKKKSSRCNNNNNNRNIMDVFNVI